MAYEKGYFFRPTVLGRADHSMRVMREETFGPVAPIMKFKTVDDAISLANDTEYGLAAYIFTNDLKTALLRCRRAGGGRHRGQCEQCGGPAGALWRMERERPWAGAGALWPGGLFGDKAHQAGNVRKSKAPLIFLKMINQKNGIYFPGHGPSIHAP